MPAQVTFVIGRAGTGKTHFVTERLKAAQQSGRAAFLLTPEQATFESERALTEALGGLMGIRVWSFTRLYERVVLAGVEKPFLSRQGRRLVLRRAARRCAPKMTVFREVEKTPGFCEKMDELMSMCKRFLLSPEDLRAAADRLGEGHVYLKGKLMDTALLFDEAQSFLSSRYLDSEDAFRALVEMLPQSELSGAEVCVDGFDLLTAQLYEVLFAILRVAARVTFTFCFDPDPGRDAALFAPEKRAFEKLYENAKAQGCEIHVVRLRRERDASDEMRHLERELFSYPARAYGGEAGNVTLCTAADRAEEVEAMADAALSLLKGGMRCREMAVIASDMPAYSAAVQRAFRRRNIPLFLDVSHAIESHPAILLCRAALKAADGGFQAQDVIAVGKSGLTGADADSLEIMENHLLETGLTGNALLTPFTAENTEEAERARENLVPPLVKLREDLRAPSGAEKARALYAYLSGLGVADALAAEAETLRSEEKNELADEYAQVWDVLVELLSQIDAVFGDTPMSRAEFIAVMDEAFAAYTVGLIPATADQVLFGTLTRTRSRSVKALFVLGCNEGMLPKYHADEDVIGEEDLAALSALGMEVWGGAKKRAENDRLDIYSAFSRSSEKIWIGCAGADGQNALLPSPLFDRIGEIFPACKHQGGPEREASCPAVGFSRLCAKLRTGGEDRETRALIDYFEKDALYAPRLKAALSAARMEVTRAPFGGEIAKALYGGTRLQVSASRVETYYTCPFRHFAAYGLTARPRREFREMPKDSGTFYHAAIEAFFKAVMAAGGNWDALTDEETDAFLNGLLPALIEEHNHGLLLASNRMRYRGEQMCAVVRATVRALVNQIRAGAFRPVATEAAFGEGQALPPVTFVLKNGLTVQLNGVIDRIDALDANQRYIRVLDYKSGSPDFRYAQVYAGQKLQLPLYLGAAARDAVPAGLFYVPVDDPALDEDAEMDGEKEFRLHGLLLSDSEVVAASAADAQVHNARSALVDGTGMKKLLGFAMKKTQEALENVYAGEYEPAPLKIGAGRMPCEWCDYKSMCRFDPLFRGCRPRRQRTLKKEEFFERIGVREGGGEDGAVDG